MKQAFDKDSPETEVLMQWWHDLENDKGVRAELRRCPSPASVMLHPAYARLHGRLAAMVRGRWQWEYRLASVIGLLARVRHTAGKSLAAQMGGTDPIVSDLRFRRLLQCSDDELHGRMIRVLAMLKNSANPPDLIDSVFNWNDATRKRWAREYFSSTPEKKTA